MTIQDLDNKDYPNILPCELDLDDNNSLKKMLQFVGYNKFVVDFGCATGYFAKLLKERGCKVVGIEINEKAATQARKFCDEVIVCDLDRPSSAVEALQHYEFDVAVFGDVLEHLKNPWSLLKKVNLVLKKNGFIVASIPNIAHGSIQLALLKGEFNYTEYGILDNTHLRFFTRNTVKTLFEFSGYRIQDWDTTKLPVFSDTSSLVPCISDQDFHQLVIDTVLDSPDCEVLQFVVRAFPSSQEERYTKLQSQLEQTQSQLEQTQSQLEQTQSQLEQTQSQLAISNASIQDMQSSKFWLLRKYFINFRRFLGL